MDTHNTGKYFFMSLRRMDNTVELQKFLYGIGGFPQIPKEKRWYTCLLGRDQDWSWTWKCAETPESKINLLYDKYASVPEYMPKFMDKYVIQYQFNNQPVSILPTLQETSETKPPTPFQPPPVSPSVRRVPSVAYTGAHKQPKNPFQ